MERKRIPINDIDLYRMAHSIISSAAARFEEQVYLETEYLFANPLRRAVISTEQLAEILRSAMDYVGIRGDCAKRMASTIVKWSMDDVEK